MIRKRLWYLSFPAVLGAISACGDCKVVQHDGSSSQVDTTDIAKSGGDCVVHVYAAQKSDSVGPKP